MHGKISFICLFSILCLICLFSWKISSKSLSVWTALTFFFCFVLPVYSFQAVNNWNVSMYMIGYNICIHRASKTKRGFIQLLFMTNYWLNTAIYGQIETRGCVSTLQKFHAETLICNRGMFTIGLVNMNVQLTKVRHCFFFFFSFLLLSFAFFVMYEGVKT